MTVVGVLQKLREDRMLVAAIMLLTIIGAVAAGQALPAHITATAQVQVYEADLSSGLIGLQQSSDVVDHDVLMDTHIKLATSPAVAQRVIEQLGLSATPKELLERLSASAQGRSNVLAFSAVAPDSEAAVALADAWVSQYLSWSAERAAANIDATSRSLAPRVTAAADRLTELEARLKTQGHTKQIDTAISAATVDYEQLLAGSARLELLADVGSPSVSVVSRPVAEEHSVVIPIVIDVLEGLLVGAILSVLVVYLEVSPRRNGVVDQENLPAG